MRNNRGKITRMISSDKSEERKKGNKKTLVDKRTKLFSGHRKERGKK